MSEWIRMRDKRPPWEEEVLTYHPDWKGLEINMSRLTSQTKKGYHFKSRAHDIHIVNPTHWMPLPEPPNSKP